MEDLFLGGESSFKCICLAFLAGFDAVSGYGLVLIGDQVLLMVSVFLTCMAGVIRVAKSLFSDCKTVFYFVYLFM